MVTMILLLYLQQGLDVTLDQANLRGEYPTMAACEAEARKPLEDEGMPKRPPRE